MILVKLRNHFNYLRDIVVCFDSGSERLIKITYELSSASDDILSLYLNLPLVIIFVQTALELSSNDWHLVVNSVLFTSLVT